MNTVVSPTLSVAIFAAAQAVKSVLAGQSLTEVLTTVPKEQKAVVQSISFYSMRHLMSAQALAQQLLSKKAPNTLVHALLLVGLSLLIVPRKRIHEDFTQGIPFYQDFTIVDETLKAAQRHKKSASFKGLLNACLRRYLREQDKLWEIIGQQETVQFDYPQWWIDLIKKSYPQEWKAILRTANIPGPLTLRVNRRKITREAYSAELNRLAIAHQCVGEDAIILEKAVPVDQIPFFQQGYCAVQDAGAQIAASLLPLRDGLRVLDACAAPGGKTAAVLERANIDMTAIDIEEKRLARVAENLKHLGLYSDKVSLYTADATTQSWWNGEPFDIVMADVPCTASGIVRRHPDIKWLRKESDIAKTARLQREIVRNLWSVLKPGGYFLYITCSVFPQEGQEQATFIEKYFSDAIRLEAPGQLLPLATDQQPRPWHDGFFYALFRKAEGTHV
ncbi:16S rRNA (cytosine(967)-C(5))-methyltransferase RsmB [Pelistega ratti]|uniref:16S rRNA (cytosine(967)-C(5))-methyltransferase RsmB n=1 Tax=Pelistega ratti TaxID=2652177 RepID=UPI00135C8DAC|nr:16S rRNA (cytosine(967)-C(5))-methyltransferase RsmB [Pelistega ratti]